MKKLMCTCGHKVLHHRMDLKTKSVYCTHEDCDCEHIEVENLDEQEI